MATTHPKHQNGPGPRTYLCHVVAFAPPPSAITGDVNIGQLKLALHTSGKRRGKRVQSWHNRPYVAERRPKPRSKPEHAHPGPNPADGK